MVSCSPQSRFDALYDELKEEYLKTGFDKLSFEFEDKNPCSHGLRGSLWSTISKQILKNGISKSNLNFTDLNSYYQHIFALLKQKNSNSGGSP